LAREQPADHQRGKRRRPLRRPPSFAMQGLRDRGTIRALSEEEERKKLPQTPWLLIPPMTDADALFFSSLLLHPDLTTSHSGYKDT
jgi:hypothetical protein